MVAALDLEMVMDTALVRETELGRQRSHALETLESLALTSFCITFSRAGLHRHHLCSFAHLGLSTFPNITGRSIALPYVR